MGVPPPAVLRTPAQVIKEDGSWPYDTFGKGAITVERVVVAQPEESLIRILDEFKAER